MFSQGQGNTVVLYMLLGNLLFSFIGDSMPEQNETLQRKEERKGVAQGKELGAAKEGKCRVCTEKLRVKGMV